MTAKRDKDYTKNKATAGKKIKILNIKKQIYFLNGLETQTIRRTDGKTTGL